MPATLLPPPLFTECQPLLRHWWGLALVAPSIVLAFSFGPTPPYSLAGMAAMLSLVTVIPVGLLALVRLYTRLDADGVRVRFAPLQNEWRFTPWAQVRRAYLRTYAPFKEYGGWGIRTFLGENEAYNAWGNQGLQLLLLNGGNLLIGTQRPAAVQQVLAQLRVRGARAEVPD